MAPVFDSRAASLVLTFFLAGSGIVSSQEQYVPSEENLKAREEFRDSKFGIFLHWGLYSMTAQGEWYMNTHNIDRDEYACLASGFYPSLFRASEWVSAIKASGAKYICITSRHHDGFSMFGTGESDYNIVDATPFGRDILKELAKECRRQGIRLHLYYSHLDWRRDDYPIGNTGHGTGRKEGTADWNSYYSFMNNQLRELLTKYGKIGAIWFDGVWDHPENFDWQLEEQYRLIHELQPACLIGNNHHRTPYPGEDFQMFERDLPGENTAGLSGQEISALPLETCETMNHHWGYAIEDNDYKSPEELVHYLVKAAGRNANLLLNIGPRPDGTLPDIAVERLREVGDWMSVYGETIYGTRGGDMPPQKWGVSTIKGDRLYIHILDAEENVIFVPLDREVAGAIYFKDKAPVSYVSKDGGIELCFDSVPDEIDTVIELVVR